MLVLRRKKDQGIQIGKDVHIFVVDITATQVAIGIDAPDDLKVLRHELLEYGKDYHDSTG